MIFNSKVTLYTLSTNHIGSRQSLLHGKTATQLEKGKIKLCKSINTGINKVYNGKMVGFLRADVEQTEQR